MASTEARGPLGLGSKHRRYGPLSHPTAYSSVPDCPGKALPAPPFVCGWVMFLILGHLARELLVSIFLPRSGYVDLSVEATLRSGLFLELRKA